MSRWSVAGPSEYWLLASSPASQMYIDIHGKSPLFLSIFLILSKYSPKILGHTISRKSVRTDMAKLKVACCNFARLSKKSYSFIIISLPTQHPEYWSLYCESSPCAITATNSTHAKLTVFAVSRKQFTVVVIPHISEFLLNQSSRNEHAF